MVNGQSFLGYRRLSVKSLLHVGSLFLFVCRQKRFTNRLYALMIDAPFLKGKEAHVKERRGRGRPLPPAIRLSSPSFPFLSGKRKAYRSIRRNGRNMSSLGLPCSHLNKRNESKTKSKRSKLWLSFLERKRNQTISRSCLPFPKGKGKEICLSMGRSRKSPSYVGLFPQTLHHVGLGSFP